MTTEEWVIQSLQVYDQHDGTRSLCVGGRVLLPLTPAIADRLVSLLLPMAAIHHEEQQRAVFEESDPQFAAEAADHGPAARAAAEREA